MKVLLIDRDMRDNIGIRWYLQLYLASDVDVQFCTAAHDVPQKLQSFMPHAVLVNVDLLPSDERSTIYAVLKRSGCAVIAMTDEPTYQQALKAVSLRAHTLLQKPIDLEKLKNTLLTLPQPHAKETSPSFYTSLFIDELQYEGGFMLIELEDERYIRALYEWLHEAVLFQQMDVYALSQCVVCVSDEPLQKQDVQALMSYWQKEHHSALNVSIYDGERCAISEQYSATKQALTQRFYTGYGHIFYTSKQLCAASFDPLLSPAQQRDIIESLEQFQLEPIRAFLKRLQQQTFEQEDVRVHLTSMLAQVRRFMLQYELQHYEELEGQYRQLFRLIIDYAIMHPIIAEILRFTQRVLEQAKAQNSTSRSFMNEASRYIQKHFADEELSLVQVANALHMSRSYTSTLFTKELGMPFSQYVQQVRLSAAEQLLATTSESITHIAARCGFRDANYFSKSFKQKKGMTPTRYRKRMQQRLQQ